MGYHELPSPALTEAQKKTLDGVLYCALGMAGEAGEVANKIKKVLRDDHGIITPQRRLDTLDECGDVLWYLARTAAELGSSLEEVMQINVTKLKRRQAAGTLKGSGDKR